MNITAFVNKHFTHNRDLTGDFGIRVLLHIPIGFLIGVLLFNDKALTNLFLKYELNEDAHTADEAWKDIFGAIIGFALGRATIIAIIIYLLYTFLK